MPDHPRKLIRQAVKMLLTSATIASTRVYASQAVPLRKKQDLPAILIATPEDSTDGDSVSTAARELKHALSLIISGLTHGTDGEQLVDDLDDLAQQIETAMHKDPQLAGCAGDLWLTGTTLDVEIEGDRLIGMCQLTYEVTYHDLTPAAPTDLVDFQHMSATYKIGAGMDDDDDAHDEVVIQAAAGRAFTSGFSSGFA